MPLQPPPLKGVCEKGSKNPYCITSGNKSQVTTLGCVSAAGHCIPPMIIFNRTRMHPDLAKGELPGTFYGLANGWMDQGLFHEWFQHHILHYAPACRPLLLLVDGHSSHYCPETIFMAAEENGVVFTFPPNTTHMTQPLDKGCFGPLKMEWRKVCHEYLLKNPGMKINDFSFNALFAEAWLRSMSMKNISGFRTTGLFPVDRSKLILPQSPAVISALESID